MQLQCTKNVSHSVWGAFFFVWLALLSGLSHGDPSIECQLSEAQLAALPQMRVERVSDGDTVIFANGDKVRLLGVNTPERSGRYNPIDEPLAAEAKQSVEQWLAASAFKVYYRTGANPRDRYQRLLAALYDRSGNSLAAHLIGQGLGWQITFVADDWAAECLANAERTAREQRRGVWAGGLYPPLKVSAITQGGFARIIGTVTQLDFQQNNGNLSGRVQLIVDGKLTVQLSQAVAEQFAVDDLVSLDQRRVELRGWLSRRGKDWQLRLTSRYNLLRLD